MTIAELLTGVADATKVFDAPRVDALAREVVAALWAAEEPLAEDVVLRVIKGLRGCRRFRWLERAAAALEATGHSGVGVRLGWIQATIEQGELDLALTILRRTRREHSSNDEVEGLLGRAHKQMYIERTACGRPSPGAVASLVSAFTYYACAYAADDRPVWHGINAVALALRAERDGASLGGDFDAKGTAKAVRAKVLEQIASGCGDGWDQAVLLECAVALDERDEALRAAAAYATDPRADAFARAGTLRQLREVWCIDESDRDWRMVTALLEARMLDAEAGLGVRHPAHAPLPPPHAAARDRMHAAFERTGGAPAAADEGFERVFGGALVSLENYRVGLESADAVCALRLPRDRPCGTGFLISGARIDPKLGEALVLVTNSHVLDQDGGDPAAPLRPGCAEAVFQTGPNHGRVFTVREVIWRSPPIELDTMIVRLMPEPGGRALEHVARVLPVCSASSHVYVIGHASGGDLAYSLMDNLLLDHDHRVVHYRSADRGRKLGESCIQSPVGAHRPPSPRARSDAEGCADRRARMRRTKGSPCSRFSGGSRPAGRPMEAPLRPRESMAARLSLAVRVRELREESPVDKRHLHARGEDPPQPLGQHLDDVARGGADDDVARPLPRRRLRRLLRRRLRRLPRCLLRLLLRGRSRTRRLRPLPGGGRSPGGAGPRLGLPLNTRVGLLDALQVRAESSDERRFDLRERPHRCRRLGELGETGAPDLSKVVPLLTRRAGTRREQCATKAAALPKSLPLLARGEGPIADLRKLFDELGELREDVVTHDHVGYQRADQVAGEPSAAARRHDGERPIRIRADRAPLSRYGTARAPPAGEENVRPARGDGSRSRRPRK